MSSSSVGTLGRCLAEQGSERRELPAARGSLARVSAAWGRCGQRRGGSDPAWSPRARRPRKDFGLIVNSAGTCISPQGCCNEVPQSWGAGTARLHPLPVLEARSGKSRCRQGEAPSHSWLLGGSSRPLPPAGATGHPQCPYLWLHHSEHGLCITWPAFLCLSLSSPFSHDDTNHIGLGPTLPQWKQQWLHAGGCGSEKWSDSGGSLKAESTGCAEAEEENSRSLAEQRPGRMKGPLT